MATAGDTERKIGTVRGGGRGYFRSKNKPIMGIDGGMLFKSKVGAVVFDRPVRFEIAGEFKEVSIFIQFTRGCFSFLFFFFQLFLADGMTGGLNQAGVNSYALVDG